MKSVHSVIDIFQTEFYSIQHKFTVLVVPALDVAEADDEYIWHPGVYVWWSPKYGVVKVGRHFTNSRKRALEHVRDNTGDLLSDVGRDPESKLILFNVKEQKDYHWVAALEIFLERTTEPTVPSKRQG